MILETMRKCGVDTDTVIWVNDKWDEVTLEIRRVLDPIPEFNPVLATLVLKRGEYHVEKCTGAGGFYWSRLDAGADRPRDYIDVPCYGLGVSYTEII